MIIISRYEADDQAPWDALVSRAKNATFLHFRNYMEYHADRFSDFSLVAREGQAIVALLPAHRVAERIVSHGGLTFGGFITDNDTKLPEFTEIFDASIEFLRNNGIGSVDYRPVPAIYHRAPSQEDLYAFFRAGATVYHPTVFSVVDQAARVKFQERRRRAVGKAEKSGLEVRESTEFTEFWNILSQRLSTAFGTAPVHTLAEIEALRSQFPENIRLYCAYDGSQMVAGVLAFESDRVAKTQYIAGSDRGLELGAVDLILSHLITAAYRDRAYVDLGSSESADGLNPGLIQQKEGFGARTVVQLRLLLQIPPK
ncbi:MAG: GNAT family N-acetyltransferase [Gemmatimonadaceae bacterium]|nr:GNAT family N-acetyltransferase [Gemmatimonadaceae bacterium]